MRKTLRFIVDVEFEDSIYDDSEVQEVAENIGNGLKYIADTSGLAPESSETYTTNITVSDINGETLNTIKL